MDISTQHLHNKINKNISSYKFPFRVGRKKGIAILDAEGKEIVIFPIGSEEMASFTCDLYNKWHDEFVADWNKIDPTGSFRKDW